MDNKIIVNVGMTDNNYSASVNIGNGIAVATGKTFEELKAQMREAIDFHLDCLRESNDEIPALFRSDYELSYKFDTESFLGKYNGIFTNAAMERLTGINQRQLQRYAKGISKPRRAQVQKIETAMHRLGQELIAVAL